MSRYNPSCKCDPNYQPEDMADALSPCHCPTCSARRRAGMDKPKDEEKEFKKISKSEYLSQLIRPLLDDEDLGPHLKEDMSFEDLIWVLADAGWDAGSVVYFLLEHLVSDITEKDFLNLPDSFR